MLLVEYGLNNLGASLDGVQVDNLGAIQIGTTVAEDPTLTFDDGTTIGGGELSINSGSALDIEVGPGGQGGASGTGYPDATLDGVSVANNGTINVDLAALGAILTLDDGATIEGGTLTIGTSEGNGSGTVDIELGPNDVTDPDARFDGVTVNNYGVIEVGQSASATLLLDDGTTVYGGSLLIGNPGAGTQEPSTSKRAPTVVALRSTGSPSTVLLSARSRLAKWARNGRHCCSTTTQPWLAAFDRRKLRHARCRIQRNEYRPTGRHARWRLRQR